jgi:outer membrane protein OmpA-like peptidoglycan-associated protein
LVIGSLASGPLGAVIGGSMGVMAGNQQTKSATITQQKQSISELESELSLTMTKLKLSNKEQSTSLRKVQVLEASKLQLQQQHRAESMLFAAGYQFDIYFMTNRYDLTTHSQQGLMKLAELLSNNPHIYAIIEAHSDWRGSNDANCLLARQRLSAVTEQLLQAGSKAEQILATSYGEQANVNSGSWGDELFYDRRVTISLNYFE